MIHSRDLSGRGTARADDAQGTPTQSHISPSILVYEDDLGVSNIVDSHTKSVKRFRGGLVSKAHRLVNHSTLGWRVIKKKKNLGVSNIVGSDAEVNFDRGCQQPGLST